MIRFGSAARDTENKIAAAWRPLETAASFT
jgi:hypothetical protein